MNSKLVKDVAWNVSLNNLKKSKNKISIKIENSRDWTSLLNVVLAPWYNITISFASK